MRGLSGAAGAERNCAPPAPVRRGSPAAAPLPLVGGPPNFTVSRQLMQSQET
jgi:hypothetical protein